MTGWIVLVSLTNFVSSTPPLSSQRWRSGLEGWRHDAIVMGLPRQSRFRLIGGGGSRREAPEEHVHVGGGGGLSGVRSSGWRDESGGGGVVKCSMGRRGTPCAEARRAPAAVQPCRREERKGVGGAGHAADSTPRPLLDSPQGRPAAGVGLGLEGEGSCLPTAEVCGEG